MIACVINRQPAGVDVISLTTSLHHLFTGASHCNCWCLAAAADPIPAELVAGVNLADVHKCNCSSKYCAAAAAGVLVFNGSVTSDKVSFTGAEPPFVFDDLPTDTACINCKCVHP